MTHIGKSLSDDPPKCFYFLQFLDLVTSFHSRHYSLKAGVYLKTFLRGFYCLRVSSSWGTSCEKMFDSRKELSIDLSREISLKWDKGWEFLSAIRFLSVTVFYSLRARADRWKSPNTSSRWIFPRRVSVLWRHLYSNLPGLRSRGTRRLNAWSQNTKPAQWRPSASWLESLLSLCVHLRDFRSDPQRQHFLVRWRHPNQTAELNMILKLQLVHQSARSSQCFSSLDLISKSDLPFLCPYC